MIVILVLESSKFVSNLSLNYLKLASKSGAPVLPPLTGGPELVP